MGYPVRNLQSGKISLAVWEAEYNGNKSYNYTLSKAYKKDGKWEDGKIFTITDFHDIINLARKILQDNIRDKTYSEQKKEEVQSAPSYPQEEFDGVPF